MATSIPSAPSLERRGAAASKAAISAPVCAAAAFVLLAAAAAVASPVWLSIVAVFVFAGPHNWVETRYFIARLPARWGRARPFFTLAIGGALTMTLLYIAMGPSARVLDLSNASISAVIASWATLAVVWCVAIVAVLSRPLGRDWTWALPAGFFAIALAWGSPGLWWLCLVYGHPLVALIFLDRELHRRPALQRGVRWLWAIVPVALVAIAIAGAQGESLGVEGGLTMRIADHAGATILPSVPDRILVGSHAFLETVHYGVWVLAMPMFGFRTPLLKTAGIPLVRRSRIGALAVAVVLTMGAFFVATLWVSFSIDYGITRDVYFAIAMLHVLVEVPFLLRLSVPRGVVRDAR